jgi:hypothetical protein
MYATQISTKLIRERRNLLVRELLSALPLSDVEYAAINVIPKYR